MAALFQRSFASRFHLVSPPASPRASRLCLPDLKLVAYPAASTASWTALLTSAHNLSPAWASPSPSVSMNGVSRFLSRRDKNHEKRSSKSPRSKVRLSSFSTADSDSVVSFPGSDALTGGRPFGQRRSSSSHSTRSHRLASALRSPFTDSTSFLQKAIHFPSFLTATIIQTLSANSDYHFLQSRTTPPSSDLYKIFTNEDPTPAADKDVEKKVRGISTNTPAELTIARSKCSFPDYRVLGSAR